MQVDRIHFPPITFVQTQLYISDPGNDRFHLNTVFKKRFDAVVRCYLIRYVGFRDL